MQLDWSNNFIKQSKIYEMSQKGTSEIHMHEWDYLKQPHDKEVFWSTYRNAIIFDIFVGQSLWVNM